MSWNDLLLLNLSLKIAEQMWKLSHSMSIQEKDVCILDLREKLLSSRQDGCFTIGYFGLLRVASVILMNIH